MVYCHIFGLGFDDMDSMYASPEDFRNMNHRDKVRGLHLLEYFVNRCHEIGVMDYPFSDCSHLFDIHNTHRNVLQHFISGEANISEATEVATFS